MRVVSILLLVFGVNSGLVSQSFQSFQKMESCPDWKCLAEVLVVSGTSTRRDWSIPWRLPLRYSGYVSSRYGFRAHPILGARKFHSGVDIAAPTGSYVYAAGNGRARYAYDPSLGHHISVDHLNGFVSTYGHLSQVFISDLDLVKQGQVLGLVGESGLATGPHLHWSVTFRGRSVDPLLLRQFILTLF